MLKQWLFKIAKRPLMGKVVGTAFRYCSFLIPVKKVYSSREILAFHHPKPSYNNHIVLSPKKVIRNLQQMASDNNRYFAGLWEAAKQIAASHTEYQDSFVLLANGGKRQEVQQVHFHMFTGHKIVNAFSPRAQNETVIYRDNDIYILEHPNANWELHFVAAPVVHDPSKYFQSVLQSIDILNAKYGFVQKGYSFVYQQDKLQEYPACPIFHIVAGRRLQ